MELCYPQTILHNNYATPTYTHAEPTRKIRHKSHDIQVIVFWRFVGFREFVGSQNIHLHCYEDWIHV